MKKIAQLINILDDKLVVELIMLHRLVNFYSKFLELWRHAEVKSDGKTVTVTFYRINKYGYLQFTNRTFPVEDLYKRIRSYKSKIKREYANRHENVRIQREIREYQLAKELKNAEI
jgi:hypothetical protein